MSQKVRINNVRHNGASVFLGVDHCGNPRWTRNPERIMVWLCDGWRTRFNQRREQRPHDTPVKDEAGEIVDWIKEPLGGPDVAELLSDKEARLQCSWMAGIPKSVLSSTDRLENTEWFAGLKRKKLIGGRTPGFKSPIAAWASSAGATPLKQAMPSSTRPAESPVWSSSLA